MKSILQGIALLSAAALVASCDSSSGGGAAGVGNTPPTPQVSASGSAVKGVIDGATIIFVDDAGNGDTIGQSTVINGTYDIAFDTDLAPFVDPIVATVTDGEAKCDFDNPDPAQEGNDCRLPDGTFTVFGTSYDISGTTLRTNISAGSEGGVASVSPLSEIAASKAATPLTSEAAAQANVAITALIEAVSGISFGGVDFTTIRPSDLTATGDVTDSPQQLALAAFGAAVLSSQAAGESINETIARLSAGITVDASGNVTGTGDGLAPFAEAFARGLAVAASKRPNTVVTNSANNAKAVAGRLRAQGNNPVVISPPATPGSDTDKAKVQAFVAKLANVINDVTSTTGAEGSGGQSNQSVTEAFASQLDTVASLTSANATRAFTELDSAVRDAAAEVTTGTPFEDTDSSDGVTFTLTKAEDGTLTLTDVVSAWPIDAEEGAANRVVITGSGEASGRDFTLTDVTMTSADSDGTGTAQTFTGTASYTYNAAADSTAVDTFDFVLTGNIVADDADPALDLALTVTGEPVELVAGSTRGTYTATFDFKSATVSNLKVVFGGETGGTIGSLTQSVSFTTDSGTITADVTRPPSGDGSTDQVTISDVTVKLVLVSLVDGTLPATGTIGNFYLAASTPTAENSIAVLTGEGVVEYNDGSIQLLPAIIFPEPQ